MGLLNKNKQKKPLRSTGRGSGSFGTLRAAQVAKQAPCIGNCPSGNDIRGWLTVIAQRDKTGTSLPDACDQAWKIEMETNPFPAIMGRICPHPCETHCNRSEKGGAVAINSVERTLGDWGLERGLAAPTLDLGGPFDERVAVIGSGPAGLSCAYQLARRGYQVTVFETLPKPGGMLRYGIPDYRLPRTVIDAEIQRLIDLGVELKCGVTVGESITFETLRTDYTAVFVAIGAHVGKQLGIPGEDGPGVMTGTEFLRRVNSDDAPHIGEQVVVIGGGDTAIDAARVSLRLGTDSAGVAQRLGSKVTILYRRTRDEMPAIDREVAEALEEHIDIVYLAAPAKVLRDASGKVIGILAQRMQMGEPDESGRRRPLPIEGDVFELRADTLITAVSQAPDTDALGAFEKSGRIAGDEWGCTHLDGVWTGGDNANLGIATTAIGQGRKAALSIHASLRGDQPRADHRGPVLSPDRLKLDYYQRTTPATRAVDAPEVRLSNPHVELDHGITQDQFLTEVASCFSCGSCFGCERCWMYCTPGCFKRLSSADVRPGSYYTLDTNLCNGCNKCVEECPCGFLDMI